MALAGPANPVPAEVSEGPHAVADDPVGLEELAEGRGTVRDADGATLEVGAVEHQVVAVRPAQAEVDLADPPPSDVDHDVEAQEVARVRSDAPASNQIGLGGRAARVLESHDRASLRVEREQAKKSHPQNQPPHFGSPPAGSAGAPGIYLRGGCGLPVVSKRPLCALLK
jgi:hypothetical protein